MIDVQKNIKIAETSAESQIKRDPQVVDKDKLRFDMFVILIEEWLRKKLRVRLTVECLR